MNINNKDIYKFYTVYKITNLINNKKYIGMHCTNNLEDNYLGSGKIIRQAVNKYGKDNFRKEILFIFDNFDDMANKEKEIINEEIIESSEYYNLRTGGEGGKLTKEIREKISNANRGRIMKKESKQLALETRIKNGNYYKSGEEHHFYGLTHSEEARKKISNSLKEKHKNGHKVWNDGIKISEIYTEEQRKKMYGVNKIEKYTEEERKEKFGYSHPGEKNPCYGSKWYGHPTELIKCFVKSNDIELEKLLIKNNWIYKPNQFMKRKSVTHQIKDYL
jgi:hypothetical protein